MKTCSKCKCAKAPSEFSRETKGKDGLQSRCKVCVFIANKERLETVPKESIDARRELREQKKKEGVKTCFVCKETKAFSFFNKCGSGFQGACKSCKTVLAREEYQKNPEKARKKLRDYYWKNPEAARGRANRYYEENTEKISEQIHARRPRRRVYEKTRRHLDLEYKISQNLRCRILNAIRAVGASKSERTKELLGCTVNDFVQHLESLFKPGMTWENHGPVWHIDHKRPCASFNLTDPEQQKKCFNWTNQQPLFAEENRRKSDKYADSPEPAHCRLE